MLARAGDVLHPERHGTPRAEHEVYDARAAHDVDRLVRMLGDVVCASAIEPDEHVVDWVLLCLLHVCADRRHRGRGWVQRRQVVGCPHPKAIQGSAADVLYSLWSSWPSFNGIIPAPGGICVPR
jgi:hypothetical protein